MEQWRPVLGYEGLYDVSDQGQVRSLACTLIGKGRWGKATYHKKEMILTPIQKQRYLVVSLHKDFVKRQYHIHRLVMAAFIGPLPEGMVTRHLNGNELDNRLANLTYGTPRENEDDKIRHGKLKGENHPTHKLNNEDIIKIRRKRMDGKKLNEISQEFGVSMTSISRICLYRSWSHI